MNGAVDVNAIKRQVDMRRLLAYYGLLADMRSTANGLRGHCPFHEDADPSFTTTPSQQGFHCFGCGKKGNVMTFVRLKEQIATGDVEQDDREAARRIQTWFGIVPLQERPPGRQRQPTTPHRTARDHAATCVPSETRVNQPLAFQLDHLDRSHPYLASRGLSPATLRHFGIGYYPRSGTMSGRIVIPIHNTQGQLVAYAGRWPEDTPPRVIPNINCRRAFTSPWRSSISIACLSMREASFWWKATFRCFDSIRPDFHGWWRWWAPRCPRCNANGYVSGFSGCRSLWMVIGRVAKRARRSRRNWHRICG
jgi:CHC2 zinc finger